MIDRTSPRPWALAGAFSVALALPLLAGCASRKAQLENVAKDWCLTIRASQVLPVYPLSEDVQPGDVFVVQTPLATQVKEYEKRGFLPLDQLLTRLPFDDQGNPSALPYQDFYRDAYWTGSWTSAAPRPGWNGVEAVAAPRVAFPTYSFEVERGGGLKLALPVSGVPVGLGILGGSAASGSVTIRDAYTYGIDIETLYRELVAWWQADEERRLTLCQVARQTTGDVYLRVVNRVYLTTGVSVSLQRVASFGAGVDVGVTPELELLQLAVEEPGRSADATRAYQETLKALSGDLNGAEPGGRVRFTQANARSVSLDEDFDRPLVLGYLGFDVRVDPEGWLSVPIPSYAVLQENVSLAGFETTPEVVRSERLWERVLGLEADTRDTVLRDTARRMGGTFDQTLRANADKDGAVIAYQRARGELTNTADAVEADRLQARLNHALEAALDAASAASSTSADAEAGDA